MPEVSLLTIVKGRRRHLNNLLAGVRRSVHRPDEVVIVFMNEDVPEDLADAGCPVRAYSLFDADHALPLAAARNRAATLANGDCLLFLDVDCIPAPDYVGRMAAAVAATDGLVMGDVRYLSAALPDAWDFSRLKADSLLHPRRPRIAANSTVRTDAYHLFWSLTFGLRKQQFVTLGGFDEAYVGYGGEDTDFAFSAREAGVPFYLTDARCYHQHHGTCTPPYNHLADIVTNARAFYAKWDTWPMEGWLNAFAESGHIDRTSTDLTILKLPTEREIMRHRSDAPFA